MFGGAPILVGAPDAGGDWEYELAAIVARRVSVEIDEDDAVAAIGSYTI